VEQQRFWPGEFLVIFLSADAFRALSRPFRQTVAGLNIDAAKIEATKDMGGLVASATNLALSVELYLKALRMPTGLSPNQTHNLDELYAELPRDLRQSVEAAYEATAKPAPDSVIALNLPIKRKDGPEVRPPEPVGPDHSLPAVLQRSRRLFETWRYLYETAASGKVFQPYEFHYLGVAADVLHLHAAQFAPGISGRRI
jgi:HEPN domain-containing protein